MSAEGEELPQPGGLFGREEEVAALEALLRGGAARLVTIIGPGGVGKTALATHLLTSMSPDYPDGAAFVQLAPVRDPGLVLITIAHGLDVREQAHTPVFDRLVAELSGRRMLLGLDNLEHLLPAAPEIAALLAACPMLTILATSRAPLNLRAEHRFPLRTLDLAAGNVASPAVALFVERARRVQPDFALTDVNSGDVEAICRGLDGLPLAIELAAARLALLTPAALRTRLDRQLRILSGGPADVPPRLRSMADAIRWSYDLLEPVEQAVCRRLAVFFGGWTLEAAEAVCGFEAVEREDVLAALGVLLDNSLIRRVPSAGAEPRYGMLETVREFGLEQMDALGDAVATRDAHGAYYVDLAERAEPEMTGAGQSRWFTVLETEHDNFRAALTWFETRRHPEPGLRIAGALLRFWDTRDYTTEGRARTESLLALPASVAPPIRGKALETVAELAMWLADIDASLASYAEARDIWRTIGDDEGLVRTGVSMATAHMQRLDVGAARTLHDEVLPLAVQLGIPRWIALARYGVAIRRWIEGQVDGVAGEFAAVREMQEAAGDRSELATTIASQAEFAFEAGDLDQSCRFWEEQLPVAIEVGEDWCVAWYLEGMARIAARGGNPELGARLLGAVYAWRQHRDEPVHDGLMRSRQSYEEVRSALGQPSYDALLASGSLLSLREAVAIAEPTLSTPRAQAAISHGLTPREAEIAGLLARRFTDREIADALVISPRTVTTHVASILGKLGVASRREVAAALGEPS